jgi:hypothetical protein
MSKEDVVDERISKVSSLCVYAESRDLGGSGREGRELGG